jgi:hypothetical protein
MILLDRCQTLRERIEKHESLRRAHKEAEGFRDRASALEEVRQALAGAMGRVRVLRLKGVAIAKMPDPTTTLAALQEYQQSMVDGSTEGGGKDYGRLKRSVDKVGKDVVAAVEKALESVKRDLPTIEEAFLKQVSHIPAYAGQVDRIRAERDALLARSEPARMAPEDLATFLERRDQLRKLADELNPEEFPKEVLEFFKAARQPGGAPFEKLTETVRAWLHERDQLRNVRVTVVGR